MQSVMKVAVVDEEKCSACSTCIQLCPVEAVRLDKSGKKPVARVDDRACLACTLCMTRCPEHAVAVQDREAPLYFGINPADAPQKAVETLCRAAHMFPGQVICYCRRIQAKDVAAAILLGAKTPEDISRATGVRTGCGVLCITAVFRLMKAASVMPGKAPGHQWYGAYLSIWDIPPDIIKKYPEYYLAEDLKAMNHVFPGGESQ